MKNVRSYEVGDRIFARTEFGEPDQLLVILRTPTLGATDGSPGSPYYKVARPGSVRALLVTHDEIVGPAPNLDDIRATEEWLSAP